MSRLAKPKLKSNAEAIRGRMSLFLFVLKIFLSIITNMCRFKINPFFILVIYLWIYNVNYFAKEEKEKGL